MFAPLRAFFFALLATALLLGTGCGTATKPQKNPDIPTVASTAQLRPGDSLTVAVQGVPDPSLNTVQIDDKGVISLPLIGQLTVAGLNAAELSQRIRETYLAKKFYTSVDVSVTVTERYVYIGGEVQRPGRIPWTTDLTLTKAIQSAGGFSLYAKEEKVTLVREQHAYELNVKLAQKSPAQDPRLTPGDSIQVPRSAF